MEERGFPDGLIGTENSCLSERRECVRIIIMWEEAIQICI